jgi:hypothetical protein
MRRMNAQSRPGHADAKRFAVRKSRGEMKPDSKEFDSMSNQNWLRNLTKPLPSLPMVQLMEFMEPHFELSRVRWFLR